MEDSRYPYTYAADMLRLLVPTKLSRSESSQIRHFIAKILNISDEELAKKLADYFKEHADEYTEKAVQETLLKIKAGNNFVSRWDNMPIENNKQRFIDDCKKEREW
jgi:hypothetical protein